MIQNLKPYPVYKDSGAPWLGQVPVHWGVRPLKHWARINQSVLAESTPNYYEFEYIDIGAVGTGTLTRLPQRLRFGNAPSRARRVLRTGDTIVSTVRTYLKAVYYVADASPPALVASTGFAALTPSALAEPRFVSYLAQSEAFANRVTAESVGTAYPAISETVLGTFHVAVPPNSEQAAIVRFLDYADSRIRGCIRIKQKLLRALEEQRQSIIYRAVTGRLNSTVSLAPPSLLDEPAGCPCRAR